jgi:hypothetical protein
MRPTIAAALFMTLCACVGAKTQADTGAQPIEPMDPTAEPADDEPQPDTDGPEFEPPGEVETTAPAESYLACGCGCCGGVDPGEAVCVGSKAELDEIERNDEQASKEEHCAAAGCSRGTLYKVCD